MQSLKLTHRKMEDMLITEASMGVRNLQGKLKTSIYMDKLAVIACLLWFIDYGLLV